MGDDQPRAEPLGLAAEQFDVRRRPFIGLHRPGEFFLDPGAEHFDRDVTALDRHRAVNLRDRGRADRHLVEPRIKAFERRAERLLD